MRADHGIVLAAVLKNEESLQHASEEIRKSNRLIALFAERHPGEIRVRCVGLSGVETVVHFELDAAAESYHSRIAGWELWVLLRLPVPLVIEENGNCSICGDGGRSRSPSSRSHSRSPLPRYRQ